MIETRVGPDDERTVCLVSRLARAHVESGRLARAVWMAQEAMDRLEVVAAQAVDFAAACPWDGEAADRAVFASAAYEEAVARESRATVEWAAHRLLVGELLAEADTLLDSAQPHR